MVEIIFTIILSLFLILGVKKVRDETFKCGAKWQADRMYTEEEVFRLTLDALDLGMKIRQNQLFGFTQKSGKELHLEWFEQHHREGYIVNCVGNTERCFMDSPAFDCGCVKLKKITQ